MAAYRRLSPFLLNLSIVHLLIYFMAFALRWNNLSPFTRIIDRDDDRYGAVQFGVVTYQQDDDGNDSTYQVSLAEFGGRSDHMASPVMSACGSPIDDLSVSSPLASDEDLLRARSERKPSKSTKATKSTDTTEVSEPPKPPVLEVAS